jgi:hypothetical protein
MEYMMNDLSKAMRLSTVLKEDCQARFMHEGRGPEIGLKAEDVDQEEFWAGVEVEMEHTKDREVSAKITLDHFAEFPKGGYYDVLDIGERFLKSIDKLDQSERKKMLKGLAKVVEQYVLTAKGQKKVEEETNTKSY